VFSSDSNDLKHEVSFLSDLPLINPKNDKLNRMPIARGIAKSIIKKKNSDSFIIGIYGAWGEGKTTLLNFTESELENDINVICVKFNPWLFGNINSLPEEFFNTIADTIIKSKLPICDNIFSQLKEWFKKLKIGKSLKKYGRILNSFSLSFGVIQWSPGKSSDELGGYLSSKELKKIKYKINDFLLNQKIKIVLFIDDLDRLDKEEIFDVLKLVKLNADFYNTTFILAIDDKVVSDSIKDRYESESEFKGDEFLKKIVQVPINLPTIKYEKLQSYCIEHINTILFKEKIQLSEDDRSSFIHKFSKGFSRNITNMRTVKRYINGLMFSLPMLKNEVNHSDLMLIEGIRLFYPSLYNVIHNYPEIFLSGDQLSDYGVEEHRKKRAREVIENTIKDLSIEERYDITDLLKLIFPRLQGIYGNVTHITDWDKEWTEQKRISSDQYFSKYFFYVVPEGEISDKEYSEVMSKIEAGNIPDVIMILKESLKIYDDGNFIRKLRMNVEKMNENISIKIALSLSKCGDLLKNPEEVTFFQAPFTQAAMLINQLLNNIGTKEERYSIAMNIVEKGIPIIFAYECLGWIHSSEDTDENDRTLTKDEEENLETLMARRIKEWAYSVKKPISEIEPRYAPFLLTLWAKVRSKSETQNYIQMHLNEDDKRAIQLIKCFTPTEKDLETNIMRKGSFGKDNLDILNKTINVKLLYDHLHKIYGSKLDTSSYDQNRGVDEDDRIVYQFSYIYRTTREQEQRQNNQERDNNN